MFVGHLAVGLAAKRVAPRAPLTMLVGAAMWADLLWPILLLLGIERVRIARGVTVMTPLDFTSYPWSHSLLMLMVWGVAIGWIYRALTRDAVGAAWIGALVVSHWVLDVLVHRADMPLTPFGGPRFGLALWNAPAVEVPLELTMLLAGIVLVSRVSRPRGWLGHVAFWSFIGFMCFGYLGGAIGPPPPSATAIAWVGLVAGWLSVVWLIGIDRTRAPRVTA
jgi:hypothetical protein